MAAGAAGAAAGAATVPAATPAATPGQATKLKEQLDVLKVQRQQVDGYIKAFAKQGQKDEVDMLRRSRLDLDMEIARVERQLKDLKKA